MQKLCETFFWRMPLCRDNPCVIQLPLDWLVIVCAQVVHLSILLFSFSSSLNSDYLLYIYSHCYQGRYRPTRDSRNIKFPINVSTYGTLNSVILSHPVAGLQTMFPQICPQQTGKVAPRFLAEQLLKGAAWQTRQTNGFALRPVSTEKLWSNTNNILWTRRQHVVWIRTCLNIDNVLIKSNTCFLSRTALHIFGPLFVQSAHGNGNRLWRSARTGLGQKVCIQFFEFLYGIVPNKVASLRNAQSEAWTFVLRNIVPNNISQGEGPNSNSERQTRSSLRDYFLGPFCPSGRYIQKKLSGGTGTNSHFASGCRTEQFPSKRWYRS